MAIDVKSKWLRVGQRLVGLAVATLSLAFAYRNAELDPGMWRWLSFGAGLGLLGAAVGTLVAVAVIVARHRSAAGPHVHN